MKYLKNNGEVYEGDYELQIARHTASHVLAQAVKRIYPEAKLAIGPAIDTGFYYDFDNLSIKQEDLEKIEAENLSSKFILIFDSTVVRFDKTFISEFIERKQLGQNFLNI